jgi:hypothetical protein
MMYLLTAWEVTLFALTHFWTWALLGVTIALFRISGNTSTALKDVAYFYVAGIAGYAIGRKDWRFGVTAIALTAVEVVMFAATKVF